MRGSKFTRSELLEYWLSLERQLGGRRSQDPFALSIVCHPGLPIFVNKYFHYFQTRAIRATLKLFNIDLTGKRCLDVGCGGGRICKILCDLGASVVGIDIQLTTLSKNIGVVDAHFVGMSVTNLGFASACFDFVST